jgi:excisionase family DNA binding protein
MTPNTVEHKASADAKPQSQILLNPITQVQTRLGIGRTLVYEMIRAGELKAVKLRGRTLIPESSLQALVSKLAEAA